jgi:hypothetical protein
MGGILRAELIGINQASWQGITVNGRRAPVLSLCRALIAAGHDPSTPLEAYRGDVLCLRVRSIGEAAALSVDETTNDGKPRFVAYRPGPDDQESSGVRSPMHQNVQGATTLPGLSATPQKAA